MIKLDKFKKWSQFIFLAFFVWGVSAVFGQAPYSKVVATDHYVHTMGGTIVDQNGIRHGGFTNESPSNGIQELHHIDHYNVPNIHSWTGWSHIYIDQTMVSNSPTSCEVYVALFYLNSNQPSYHGFLPCSLFVGQGQYASLISNVSPRTQEIYDYDLQVYDANIDIDILSKQLFGTPALEQNFFHTECNDNNFSPSADGEYYLGASRMRVACAPGPMEPIIAKIREDNSLNWVSDLTYQNEIQQLQVDQVLGLDDGGVLLLLRSGWGPGGIMCLNANGSFHWAKDYALAGVNSVSWPITNYTVQAGSGAHELYVWCLDYDPTGHRSALMKLDANTGVPLAFGQSGQSAASYAISGAHFVPSKLFRKTESEYVAIGDFWHVGLNDYSSFIMSIQNDGTVNWCNLYDHGVGSSINAVKFAADGRLLVSGSTLLGASSTQPDYENMYLLEIGANGSYISGHYYEAAQKHRNVTLLTPATGDRILDGYVYTSVFGGSNVSTFRRLFTRTDYGGQGLDCMTVPFEPTVIPLSPGPSYREAEYHKVDYLNIRPLSPEIFDINLTVEPTGCEDCNCE